MPASRAALIVAFASLLAAAEARAQPRLTLGAGTGLPYGSPLIGVGASLEIGPHFALLAGAGPGSDAIWAAGARIHFRRPAARWRPHLSVLGFPDGWGVYGGVDHDVGRPGKWFLTYGAGAGDVNLEASVGLLFGVGFRFGR